MGNCPVCGCKTDELDFVSADFSGKEIKICSFCLKQLKSFEGNESPAEAQKRWLGAVISKDVPERESAVSEKLSALQKIISPQEIKPEKEVHSEPKPPVPKAQKAVHAPSAKVQGQGGGASTSVEMLQKRVEALESEIKRMKRSQMIKTIIELGLPVVMLLLLIILFFATGLADSLSAFSDIIESDFM